MISIGYTQSIDFKDDYYKLVSDKSSIHFTFYPTGLIASLDFNKQYSLTEEISDELTPYLMEATDKNEINHFLSGVGFSNDAASLYIKPNTKIDLDVLTKIENTLNDVVCVIESKLI